jgi:peptide chain release factor subunit 1
VLKPCGPTFDRNGWRDYGRVSLDNLRRPGLLVRLDAVGRMALMIPADIHRDGLIFPPPLWRRTHARPRPGPWAPYGRRGKIETEGLGQVSG